MTNIVAFDEYLSTLGRLTGHIDPTAATPEADAIKDAARDLATITSVDTNHLAAWVQASPHDVPVLGLTGGVESGKAEERAQASVRHERLGHARPGATSGFGRLV